MYKVMQFLAYLKLQLCKCHKRLHVHAVVDLSSGIIESVNTDQNMSS